MPLRFAATGVIEGLEYSRYDPFHLICATMQEVFLLSWNGARHEQQRLSAGAARGGQQRAGGHGPDRGAGHARRWRRGWGSSGPGCWRRGGRRRAPKVPTEQAWGPWVPLVEGAGLDPEDDRALLVRREFGERTWGTTSVSLVGLRAGGVRYDFSGQPGDRRSWTPVIED